MLNAGTLRSYVEGLQRLERHPSIRRLAGAPQEGRQAHPQLFKADVGLLLEGDELLQEEVFGPATVVVEAADEEQLARALDNLHGQLSATLIGEADDLAAFAGLVPLLERKAGRLLFNGYPTGVEVCDAMVHGGPTRPPPTLAAPRWEPWPSSVSCARCATRTTPTACSRTP